MENPSLVNNQAEVDISGWKVSIVAAFGILFAILFGFFLSNGSASVFPILFGALFLMVFVLQAFFIKSGNIGGIVIIVESIGLATPFFVINFSFLMFWTWLLVLIFLWAGNLQGKRELTNQLKIMFFRVERPVISKALTAITILISVFYAGSFSAGDTGVVKSILDISLRSSAPLVKNLVVKNFSFDMSVEKFLEGVAVKQLGDKFSLLPALEKNALLNNSFNELKKQSIAYGLDFGKNDTIMKVVENYILGITNKASVQNKTSFVLILALIFFLLLRSLGFLVQWIIAGPLYLLYQVLLVFGFARISLESRSREIILLG